MGDSNPLDYLSPLERSASITTVDRTSRKVEYGGEIKGGSDTEFEKKDTNKQDTAAHRNLVISIVSAYMAMMSLGFLYALYSHDIELRDKMQGAIAPLVTLALGWFAKK